MSVTERASKDWHDTLKSDKQHVHQPTLDVVRCVVVHSICKRSAGIT